MRDASRFEVAQNGSFEQQRVIRVLGGFLSGFAAVPELFVEYLYSCTGAQIHGI